MKKLLPLGSVVLLENGKKRLLIYGRVQKEKETNELYDYIGCVYPEGTVNTDTIIMFNHEDIERVFFIGFQDEEELEFQKVITDFYEKREAGK